MKISDLLVSKGSKVITTHPDNSLKQAIKLLEDYNIGGLVVVDKGNRIVGMITERDLIRYAASENPDFTVPIRSLMTRKVVVGMPHDDLESVAHTMTEKHFRHLPVVERGQLVGIITIGDIVKAQRDRYQGQVHTLETMIIAEEEIE